MSLLVLAVGCLAFFEASGAEGTPEVQTVWRLIDYIAVDYPAAVQDSEVISEVEYAEMTEFANSVASRLADLPPSAARADLLRQSEMLQSAIMRKAPAGEVAGIARKLADDLLAAYPVTLSPSAPPDLARGKTLYADLCASCHGASGRGDGQAAEGLEPPPIDFTDRSRARERSIFALYQVIGQGLEDTSMGSFASLPADDRWALAFHVGGLAFSDDEAESGERIWTSDPELRDVFPDLEAVTRTTEAVLATRLRDDEARFVTAYLRRHPEAALSAAGGPLGTARTRLIEGRSAYLAGERRRATDLALSAYLDGFELVEPALAVRDAALMRRVEAAMIELRSLIGERAPAEAVEAQFQTVSALIDEVEQALAAEKTARGASFVGAFTILLREGLEALLIVVAMVAFIRKAERPEVVRYVHAGWLAALAAGALTWVVANNLIAIGGASRELTEGIGAVLAAIVLVSVGIWMHGKSQADAWQKYIGERMSRALTRRSAWFLFLLAFVVVYREAFETILFFIALWSQGEASAILAGAGLAVVVLAGCAWALLSYSRRLPIAQFFRFSSVLVAVLAVVLAGKGIAALQEAGWFDVSPVAWLPRAEILGLYPTWEGVAGQLCVLGVLIAAFWINHRRYLVSSN